VLNKASADMAMLMDIIDCLLDRPYVHTLVLMTGDSDFIRVTARARNRFGKQVVISGVPGSVSSDLVESADLNDPLSLENAQAVPAPPRYDTDDGTRLLQLILWLNQNRPYMTFGFIRAHALSPHHALGLTEERVTDLLTSFKEHGILVETQMAADDGRTLRILRLAEDNATVAACRELEPPAFEDNRPRERDAIIEPIWAA
jgi:hypothetical protein